MKKVAAAHVLQNNLISAIARRWTSLLVLSFSFFGFGLAPPTVAATQGRCTPVKMQAGAATPANIAELSRFLDAIKTDIISLRAYPLLQRLHPQLRHKLVDVDKILQRMKFVLGHPFEISYFRIWNIENPSEQMTAPIECDDDGTYKLFPHYGQKQHYFVWLQLLGEKELGRILMSVVQEGMEQKIGYFNFHKWTHQQKDFEVWLKEGNDDLKKGHRLAAFVKYDIARKLISGNPHLEFSVQPKLDAAISENFPGDSWITAVRAELPGEQILSATSLFTLKGIGLSLSFRLKKELPGREVQKLCKKQLGVLTKRAWFSSFEGIKCSYLLDGEAPGRPSRTGSLYLAKEP